jgi:demethylmenaquinone methyltransferase / 2-methoxy-6-polyprenyl-1,4-benzoquinol methylase
MSTAVRDMFSSIAPTYDRVNSVLSLGTHHRWRRTAVALSGIKRGDRVLDCASGTGDLALEIKDVVGADGHVTATDFCEDMLVHAKTKAEARGISINVQTADCMHLPFADGAFDAATIAFGIRNVDDPRAGLAEMARVTCPGGTVMVLEFGQPKGIFFPLAYRAYSAMMPWIGGVISGNLDAYRYLPRTAAAFPAGDAFLELMQSTGRFAETRAHALFNGIAYVYTGTVRQA